MTPSRLLKLSAIYLAAIGILSLLVPRVAAAGLGQPMTAFDVFAARTVGAILITVALLNWSTSSQAPESLRGALLANIFMNTALGTIGIVNIVNGTIGAANWSGVTIHAVLLASFLFYLVRGRRFATPT